MQLITFELRVRHDAAEDVRHKHRAMRAGDPLVIVSGRIAKQPGRDAHQHDHRALRLNPLDEQLQICKCFFQRQVLQKIIPAKFHDHEFRIACQHVAIQPLKRIARRVAADTRVDHVPPKRLGKQAWIVVSSRGARAFSEAVSETDDRRPG